MRASARCLWLPFCLAGELGCRGARLWPLIFHTLHIATLQGGRRPTTLCGPRVVHYVVQASCRRRESPGLRRGSGATRTENTLPTARRKLSTRSAHTARHLLTLLIAPLPPLITWRKGAASSPRSKLGRRPLTGWVCRPGEGRTTSWTSSGRASAPSSTASAGLPGQPDHARRGRGPDCFGSW